MPLIPTLSRQQVHSPGRKARFLPLVSLAFVVWAGAAGSEEPASWIREEAVCEVQPEEMAPAFTVVSPDGTFPLRPNGTILCFARAGTRLLKVALTP
jgi:hypothetical protein